MSLLHVITYKFKNINIRWNIHVWTRYWQEIMVLINTYLCLHHVDSLPSQRFDAGYRVHKTHFCSLIDKVVDGNESPSSSYASAVGEKFPSAIVNVYTQFSMFCIKLLPSICLEIEQCLNYYPYSVANNLLLQYGCTVQLNNFNRHSFISIDLYIVFQLQVEMACPLVNPRV